MVDHFLDEVRFITSASLHMRQREKSVFTDQEVYAPRGTLSTLKVNGAREAKKLVVYEVVKAQIVHFLQETHCDILDPTDWSREWVGQVLLSHDSTSSGEVGILFARSFSPINVEGEQVVEGKLMIVRASFNSYNMVFMNIYATMRRVDRKVFLDKVCFRFNRWYHRGTSQSLQS